MITCTRIIEWDMGHRLVNHEGKCRRLHGHRYKAEITCAAEALDEVGRVIDFGLVKQLVGDWIDREWDHRMMLICTDPLAPILEGIDPMVLVQRNPTAENIATILLSNARQLLNRHGVGVLMVKLWETPNCYAVAT